jgi:hypothetical protein
MEAIVAQIMLSFDNLASLFEHSRQQYFFTARIYVNDAYAVMQIRLAQKSSHFS